MVRHCALRSLGAQRKNSVALKGPVLVARTARPWERSDPGGRSGRQVPEG